MRKNTGSPAPSLVSNYSFLIGEGAGIVGAMTGFEIFLPLPRGGM